MRFDTDELFEKKRKHFFETIDTIKLLKDPSARDMTNFQVDLDIIRTELLLELGEVQATMDYFASYCKAKEKLLFTSIKHSLKQQDPKSKPTVDEVNGYVQKQLEEEITGLSNLNLPKTGNILSYRLTTLLSYSGICISKQSSMYTPNQQIKYEHELSYRQT